MKIQRLIKYAAITLAGLALAVIAPSAKAQPTGSTVITDYTNTFDNNGNTTVYLNIDWMYWYSIYADCIVSNVYNLSMSNDPTMDADGNTNASGSLLCYSPFAPRGTTPPGGYAPIPSYGEQNLMSGTFGGGQFDTSVVMEILTITNISFKIHVLPGTVTDANGNFGSMEVGLKSTGYNADTGNYTNEVTIPGAATNGWVLLQETNAQQFQNVAETTSDTYAQGVELYYTSYATGYPTNPVTFWIDDLQVHSSVVPPPPPPPPILSISKASPGLNLFGSTGTSINNREDIETTAGNYSWVGASGPVTYSFDISSYPIPDLDDFQCQIFLIPNPGTGSAPDYSAPNCIFMDLERTTNGGASCTFRYKTNSPNGNAMIYNTNIFGQTGVLAEIVNSNGAVGTWSLTFADNTNVTMSGPGGITTNFSIPDGQFIVPAGGQTNVPAGTIIPAGSTSALFASDVFLYYGVQGNNVGGNGDHLVVTNFTVTGLGSSDFSDDFISDAETYGSVNPSIWMTNAAYPACIQDVAPGNPYWVQWTQPASGFALQATPTLLNPAWTLTTNNPTFVIGTNYTQLISTNDFPGTNAGFFGLVQRTFTQLQILLTGETAAPGTPTGETGTPTYSISTTGATTVTVNAVDAKWYPVPGITDNVTISTSDPAAVFAGATTGNLVNGTFQAEMAFGTPGNQTVTVVDNTNTNIPPATVTVNVTP